MPMDETIVAAAIKVPVDAELAAEMWRGEPVYPEFLIVSSPPPARHHSLIHPTVYLTGLPTGPTLQGFLTSTGRYVDRLEAMSIAIASNQPRVAGPGLMPGAPLYSEDLW